MIKPQRNPMKGIGSYGDQLTKEDIDKKLHRNFVGGLWDELGQLQCDFLKTEG